MPFKEEIFGIGMRNFDIYDAIETSKIVYWPDDKIFNTKKHDKFHSIRTELSRHNFENGNFILLPPIRWSLFFSYTHSIYVVNIACRILNSMKYVDFVYFTIHETQTPPKNTYIIICVYRECVCTRYVHD